MSKRKLPVFQETNEVVDRREARLAQRRLSYAAHRAAETPEEREARLAQQRLKAAAHRATETAEEREARLAANRLRNANRRTEETAEAREARLAANRCQSAANRNQETDEQRENRMSNRLRLSNARANNWSCLKGEAFRYDPTFEYSSIPLITIGNMSIVCIYCNALKFEGETSGLCCSGGKVLLSDLPELPEPLKSLVNGTHNKSKEFLRNIRKYNSSFQMTSFGTSVPTPQSTGFMPTFKIQGQVYHKIGSLLPLPNMDSNFLNIYFLGDENIEAQRRCAVILDTDQNLIVSLQKMLHENNMYVQQFKTALDTNANEDLKIVIKADKKPNQGHPRVFNTPVVSETAIIIAGNQFEKRDIVLTLRNNELTRISETHISYDALQYPLMFPLGEDGYAVNIPQVQPGTRNLNYNKMVSAMSFYAYRLMVRSTGNRLLNYRQLLNQYLVDMYAKIETERLLYIRLNQKKLRVDEYIHLKDSVGNDGDAENHGKLVILPSTYTGGPRNMHEYAQDAISYVRHGGKPSLFITYTFNPNCAEMNENLTNGQTRIDRHDLIARIFRQKLIKFVNVLTKGELFGPVKYWLYSVEWQKRGLPHAHLLVWLTSTLRMSQVDDIISAEIPDPAQDKQLYDIVIKNMVHGPCGVLNPNSPCMKNNKCTKMYPREFTTETRTLNDGYPLYRRLKPENGGHTTYVNIKKEQVLIDNRWIVPYSPILSKMFDAHINVECCNSVQSIKYILKYVHKGSDQGVFTTESDNNNGSDEITEYQAGRYISSNEAAWRIFGFPIHERYPAVIHLDIHLENGQRVYFNQSNLQNIISNPPKTTLTEFFELCKTDLFAKTLLYCEVPTYYSWNKSKKIYTRRVQGSAVENQIGIRSSDVLSRVYTVNAKNFDCFYLRILLHKIRGPTSYKDLRTVNGVEQESYHAACLALGLLEHDNQWEETLEEAKLSDSPSKIRSLYAIILSFCEPSNPKAIWEKYKNCMAEDILYRLQRENPQQSIDFSEDIYNEALILIEDKILEMIGKPMSEVGMVSPSRCQRTSMTNDLMRELSYNAQEMIQYCTTNEPRLNEEQRVIYEEVLRRFNNNEGGVIFIDAPGGTGKTFLINLLLARIRSDKKVALAVASSGIAATLMTGGRTAQSTLQIPLDLIHNEAPVCNIKKGTAKVRVLIEAKVLFWDEISMMHKHGFEAVNRTLQDIRGNANLMGGLQVIIAGDFRQTLPVIPRGTMVDEINACLKTSFIWKEIKIMKLTKNMRVNHQLDNSGKFSEYIFQIGNGNEPLCLSGKIKLGKFGTICNDLKCLVDNVYPNLRDKIFDSQWLKERAILAPLNIKVESINLTIQDSIASNEKTYLSIDKCVNDDEATNYPTEFLNSLNPSGVPPHKLILKVGSPVMLLRNLDPPKLCNGSRLVVKTLNTNFIEATILAGQYEGEDVFIPRIPLIPTDLPFSFKRLQYPLRLAYAITINKAQGQSLSVTGIDLTDECFSHGQLYVGMSRAKDPTKLYVLADPNGETKNIVYKQILK